MKCVCGNEFGVKLAAKSSCQGCRILTAMTTVLTVQCNKCGKIMQIPVQSKSVISVKKEED